MDRNKVEIYAQGGDALVKAFEGLTEAQLHLTPMDNSWTLHQNAIHMMDSDLIGSDRMKRIACMPNPLLCGYDESAFNSLPGVSKLNAMDACEVFRLNRQMTAVVLRALPDETFARTGIHTESGKLTLEQMLDKYIEHLRHHLVIISRKRKMTGKPVPALATWTPPA
jgi:hypothetical protein